MKAWQIFTHSLRQVTGNLESAMKISLIPMLIQIAAALVLLGGSVYVQPAEMMRQPGALASNGGALLIVSIVGVATGMWMAVNWHRFVLLGEMPQGYVSALPSDKIWAYFRRMVVAILIIFLAALPFGALHLFVTLTFLRELGESARAITFALIVFLPMGLLAYRLMISLPGAALGSETVLMAGWNATRDENATIFLLALISVAANLVLGVVGGLLSVIPVLGIGIGFLSQWLATMVGLSILTTLYGHYVEGRALS